MTDVKSNAGSAVVAGVSGFLAAGPIGAAVGFATSLFSGAKARYRQKQAELKILKANTAQSYDYSQTVFSDLKLSREDTEKKFLRDQSAARAKYGGSGADLESGAYQARVGSVARERDDRLTDAQQREDEFYASDAYGFVKKEFESIGSGVTNENYTDGNESTETVFSIAAEGTTGQSFFTKEQAGNLRTYTDPEGGVNVDSAGKAIFDQYRLNLRPSEEEYIKSRFGSDEDKARFESDMTQRINRANSQFDSRMTQLTLERERKAKAEGLRSGD